MNLTKMQKETAINILSRVYDAIDSKVDETTPIDDLPSVRLFFKLTDSELAALFNFIHKLKNEDIN